MSAVPLKLQISGKNEKSASLGLRQVLCRLRGRYGKILLTAEPFSFFQLGSYRIGVGISGSHRLPKKSAAAFSGNLTSVRSPSSLLGILYRRQRSLSRVNVKFVRKKNFRLILKVNAEKAFEAALTLIRKLW